MNNNLITEYKNINMTYIDLENKTQISPFMFVKKKLKLNKNDYIKKGLTYYFFNNQINDLYIILCHIYWEKIKRPFYPIIINDNLKIKSN